MKACPPRLVRPAGSAIDVNEEQSQKADLPILVRPAGSAMDVRDLSPPLPGTSDFSRNTRECNLTDLS